LASAGVSALVVVAVTLTIVATGRLVGSALRLAGQPAALGPVLAGILLGPSVLGALGGPSLGPDSSALLRHVGDVGLGLFMFGIGLELDLQTIVRRRRTVGSIAAASLSLPFALGAGVALLVHERYGVVDGRAVGLLPFVLFIATAMALTAFPVLAAIVHDQGLHDRPLGALALSCAAANDAAGWVLLTIALAVAQNGGVEDVALALAGTCALAALLALVVRPRLLLPLARRHAAGSLRATDLALLLGLAAAAAAATNALGTHVVLGAFLAGAVTPRGEDGMLAADVRRALVAPGVLLIPVGFAAPGLALHVPALGIEAVGELALITLTASVGKIGGAALSARHAGLDDRDALALGALMNARGLVEVVALTAGRAAGLIDDRLFAVMLGMALLTTAATVPLLRLLDRTGIQLARA
jgi:Kef-type K+ transport system membrane component KefB